MTSWRSGTRSGTTSLPIVEQAYAGEPVHMDDITLMMERRGYPEEAHFSFSYTPVRDESGAIAGFFCPCTDITGQIMAERRIASETERQRRLFEQAPGFVTILGEPEHRFEFVNQAYRRLFGDRDFVGRNVREAFPELEGQGFYEWLDQAYATGERFVASHADPLRRSPVPNRPGRSSSTSSTSPSGTRPAGSPASSARATTSPRPISPERPSRPATRATPACWPP